MKPSFIQTCGTEFVLDGQPIRLRGYTLGTWMNLEHFMVGLPGTHTMIRRAFAARAARRTAHAAAVASASRGMVMSGGPAGGR